MKNLTTTQKEFVSVAKEMFGDNTTQVSRQDVIKMINDKGVKYPVWLLCLLYTSPSPRDED